MSIKEQIESQIKKAMIEHNEADLNLYRMLKSVIKNTEIAKGHELEDAEVLAVLETQAKQRRDSIEQYKTGGREDLAAGEEYELKTIENYLPEKLGEADVAKVVDEVIAANPEADFGRVMGMAMGKLKGQADGALVQKVVKEKLGA